MELKPKKKGTQIKQKISINRTFMELKLRLFVYSYDWWLYQSNLYGIETESDAAPSTDEGQVSIEPLWN